MDVFRFAAGVGFSDEALKICLTKYINDDEYAKLKEAFYADSESVIAQIEKRDDKHKFLLWFLTRLAVDLYPEYVKRNINDDIYFDTFKDFEVWNRICIFMFGQCGLIEGNWLAISLKMKLFKIGRLQYEYQTLKFAADIDGQHYPAGTPVLNLHIRREELFTDEVVSDSLEKAAEFFGAPLLCVCSSWMLSPALKELMQPDSNIIKFQNRFTVLNYTKDNNDAEKFVFGQIKENPDDYPYKSSFSERLKAYIKAHGSIGVAYGIFIYKSC